MSQHLSYMDTKRQSLQVFGQFGESRWIPFAKENAKLERRNTEELRNIGLGKVLVLVAMGESLEENIDTLKEYRNRVDIICCDKAFVPLMDRGIRPDFVMICDANIPARHYETHVLHTQDIRLIATPYANVLWTKPWMGSRYFYVNKDAIFSEDVFLPIMGQGTRVIPASSNVSNAMLVFMVGADEKRKINWAGYEKYLLVGYDYSWRPKSNYYAWSNPVPKRHYMHALTLHDYKNEYVFTSHNLRFSARWLHDYITFNGLPVVNCSERGILSIPFRNTLEKELRSIGEDRKPVQIVREAYDSLKQITLAQAQAQRTFDRAREALWQSAAMQK